ncbi:calcium-binding protein [Pseudomonas sp. N40(2020)]|uniref:calcium-binding protein n=1 Tax=Pseudomonas sp. N40(2020) TaxID=2767798 RepID=UPI001656C934|nr:calcium-binding protein [Pseudomonas sp. N40(2020)]MBC8998873.1 calcium-binding protein [Pseudomonas sp. N40(2020)]
MATLIQDAVIQTDAVVITDIGFYANERNDSTFDLKSDIDTGTNPGKTSTGQLKMVDDLFGPIKIDSTLVTRVALDALGATIGGQRLNGQNTFFRVPSQSFINTLQLSSADIDKHIKLSTGTDSYLLPTLLFEIASRRPLTAPPMMKDDIKGESDPDGYFKKLSKLLDSAQQLNIQHINLPKSNSRAVAMVKSYSMVGSSVGIQGFGIFMGIRGIIDAIRKNNTVEVVINTGGIVTELGSIAVDIAVTKMATQMLTAGQSAYKDFAKTRFAVRLGRSGGLIGGALTLPFDLYTAVRSFNAAEKATGKEAMDHYVSAGLSITSAAMTVLLGAAAMAGFSLAGPVGLVAGALLAIGSQVYGAVRVVDDIDDYIELSLDERWRTGMLAFCMQDPEASVQDRYLIAKTRVEHTKQFEKNARRLLDVELKDTTEAVVNGSFDVELIPTRKWTRNWWTKQDGWETVNVPRVKGLDDTIDARDGVTDKTPGAQLGTAGENKGVLWFIGDGKDSIKGVEQKPNAFHYGAGKKNLTGGLKDDRFVFEGAADLIKQKLAVVNYSKLTGGEGNDTLVLGGKYYNSDTEPFGYDVDLQEENLYVVSPDTNAEDGKKYTYHSLLESIENVETVTGATSSVYGTDDSNIIKSRGKDTIKARGGDDQIYLLHEGASASGEAGADGYVIAHVDGRIEITEDGEQDSFIALSWRKDQIESVVIEENALVITSKFDYYHRPRNVLTIKDVYETIDNKHQLKNNKLTFITKDGFHLFPDLPDTLESDDPATIQLDVTLYGKPERAVILYDSECIIKHNNDISYFIPRTSKHTTIHSAKRTDGITKLFLDYTSDELTKVEAHFSARLAEVTEDLMIACDLTYYMGEKSLTVKNLAYARGGDDPMNILKILRTMAIYLNYKLMLVFKDGLSINAVLPKETETAPTDQKYAVYTLTKWTTPISLPLKFHTGEVIYELPENEVPGLDSDKYACAKLTSYPNQTAIESLAGQGSNYLIHLAANMSIRLGTPGALATSEIRLPFASTWDLDATDLGKVEIKLENNQLQIGTCTIHLPIYESEDLIDQVRVITAKGVVHTVDLSFDRIYLDGLDARFFDEPSDPQVALPDEFSLIADKLLRVRYVVLTDDRTGTLRYSMPTRRWILDSDKSRVIESSELQILNRCSHQLPDMFKTPTLIQVPPA